MSLSERWRETMSAVAPGHLSAVRAMLHFDRTGRRLKPRLVVENLDPIRHQAARPRPRLRVLIRTARDA
jgi:hypothetical protein